jgi:hypothetical protein
MKRSNDCCCVERQTHFIPGLSAGQIVVLPYNVVLFRSGSAMV